MATNSSSLPLGALEDGSTTFNSPFSPISTADEGKVSDVPLLSDVQLNDRRRVEGEGALRAGSRTSESADSGTTIDDLPDEVMLEIFSYMSVSENINVLQRVCSRWKRLAQDAHLWLHKKYVVRYEIKDGEAEYETSEEEAIETFAAVPELRTVIMEKEVSPMVFEALSRSCPRLHTLETDRNQMLTLSEAENLFDGCREIRTLSISDRVIVSDASLVDTLARLAGLRALRLQEHNCWEAWEFPLRALADSCPHLSDLKLGWSLCYRIQDAEYFISSHKSLLQHLNIRWTSVEGRSVAPLLPVCAEALRTLTLNNYTGVDAEQAAEAFSALGRLHNLRRLTLHFDDFKVRHLLPAVFENGGLPKLQQLQFMGIMMNRQHIVVDEMTRALAKNCPELRELVLWDCMQHTDALFEPLHRLQHLERLKIQRCKCLRGKAMSYIAKLPALHTLEFRCINFNRLKPSVDCILELSGLRRLSFQDSDCRAIPFDKFPGRLVNLRELEIDYCDGDQEVLDRVCAQMPDLKVEGTLGAWLTDSDDDDDDD